MRFLACWWCLLVPVAGGADTYSLTRITVDGHAAEAKLYQQGSRLRLESAPRHIPTITLTDQDSHTTIILDPVRHEYMPLDLSPSWIPSLAIWLQRPLTPSHSGMIVHRHFQLIDTGEQRVSFGHAAKHLRMIAEVETPPGACLSASKTERDGWYFAAGSKKPRDLRYEGHISAARLSTVCADTVVDEGPIPTLGYPVYERITVDGSLVQIREAVDFSEADLDPQLFRVPEAYRKVDAMPWFPSQSWKDRIGRDWTMLTAAVRSWL